MIRLLIVALLVLPCFAATKLRMHSSASSIGTYKQMDAQLGAGLTTSVTNSAASGTQIQWTATAGGTALSWISNPLAAGVTISGTVTLNTWASESNAQCNCGQRVVVKRYTGGAEGSTVTDTSQGSELTTSITNRSWTATPTSTAFSTGDRIVVYWYLTNAGGTMGGSRSVTSDYDGTVNASDGETFVQFTEALTFAFTVSAFDTSVPSSGAVSVVRTAAFSRADSVNAAASPVLARVAHFTRSASDVSIQSVVASDFVTPSQQNFSRSAVDTAFVAESATRVFAGGIDPIESIAAGLTWNALTNSDWTGLTNTQWLTLDQLGVTVTAAKGFFRSASDTTFSAVSAASLKAFLREAADNGLSAESVTASAASAGITRSMSDTALPAGSEVSLARGQVTYTRSLAVNPGIAPAVSIIAVPRIGPVSLIR